MIFHHILMILVGSLLFSVNSFLQNDNNPSDFAISSNPNCIKDLHSSENRDSQDETTVLDPVYKSSSTNSESEQGLIIKNFTYRIQCR